MQLFFQFYLKLLEVLLIKLYLQRGDHNLKVDDDDVSGSPPWNFDDLKVFKIF